MVIDQSRYAAFLKNPEYFRMRYMLDLDCKDADRDSPNHHGRRRGTAFHIMSEEHHKASEDAAIVTAVAKAVPNDREAVDKAVVMFGAYKKAVEGRYTKVAAEVPFCVPIPGSPHSMSGRVDGIVSDRAGKLWCEETKTAGRYAKLPNLKWEWSHNPQADFEIIGAKANGYDVAGVMVQTVVDAVPHPRVWPIEVLRTPQQLAILQYNVHQVCEIIRMLQDTFGVEKPWPHVPTTYNPCNTPGKCDFDGDCRKIDVPDGYLMREEHLELMTEKVWRSTKAA